MPPSDFDECSKTYGLWFSAGVVSCNCLDLCGRRVMRMNRDTMWETIFPVFVRI